MRKILLTLTSLLVAACGGGGGSSSSASPTTTTTPVFANQVIISANVNSNAYPTLYAAVASSPVFDDTCLVAADSISYPAAYEGAFPLPPPPHALINIIIKITKNLFIVKL